MSSEEDYSYWLKKGFIRMIVLACFWAATYVLALLVQEHPGVISEDLVVLMFGAAGVVFLLGCIVSLIEIAIGLKIYMDEVREDES